MTESKTLPELKIQLKKHLHAIGGVRSVRFMRQGNFTIATGTLFDGRLAVGVAHCADQDSYDWTYGRIVALSRIAAMPKSKQERNGLKAWDW